nr:hypothetical protein XF16B_51080 [Bradyrhizobium diazoefficiens]
MLDAFRGVFAPAFESVVCCQQFKIPALARFHCPGPASVMRLEQLIVAQTDLYVVQSKCQFRREKLDIFPRLLHRRLRADTERIGDYNPLLVVAGIRLPRFVRQYVDVSLQLTGSMA